MSSPSIPTEKKQGLFLKYKDFKKLEEIIEGYNLGQDKEGNEEVDFNSMKPDEKAILWKIKTIIRNMESVRLRSKEGEIKE